MKSVQRRDVLRSVPAVVAASVMVQRVSGETQSDQVAEANWKSSYYDSRNSSYNPNGIELVEKPDPWLLANLKSANRVRRNKYVTLEGDIFYPTGGGIGRFNLGTQSSEVLSIGLVSMWGYAFATYEDKLVYLDGQGEERSQVSKVDISRFLDNGEYGDIYSEPRLISHREPQVLEGTVYFAGYNYGLPGATEEEIEAASTPGVWSVDLESMTLNWKYDLYDELKAGKDNIEIAVGSDKVYVVDIGNSVDKRTLWAIRRADGRLSWRQDIGGPVETSPPTVLADGVIVPKRGDPVKYGKAEGRQQWRKNQGSGIHVLTLGDEVVAMHQERVVRYESDGTRVWEQSHDDGDGNTVVWYSISGGGQLAYLQGYQRNGSDNVNHYLIAIDAETGDLQWRMELPAVPLEQPLVTHLGVYMPLWSEDKGAQMFGVGRAAPSGEASVEPAYPFVGDRVTVTVEGDSSQYINVSAQLEGRQLNVSKQDSQYQVEFTIEERTPTLIITTEDIFHTTRQYKVPLAARPATETPSPSETQSTTPVQSPTPTTPQIPGESEDTPGAGTPGFTLLNTLTGLAGYTLYRRLLNNDPRDNKSE